MPQSVPFEALTASEQEASKTRFSTTAPGPNAPKNPHARLGVELSHTMWKLRIECPCPSKKPVNGRPDSIVNALVPVSGQTASPIGVHVSMPVMSMSLSSTTKPRSSCQGARLSPALTAAANSMRSSAVSIPPGDAKA